MIKWMKSKFQMKEILKFLVGGGSGNTFSPSEAGKGTHVIRWKSASNSGNIRIIVK